MQSSPSFALAQQLDDSDSLRKFRERFYSPEGRIYLDSNSLGLLSRDAERTLLSVLEQCSQPFTARRV
jgi:kynureninase